MYSRKSWGGDTEPFILTKFIKPDNLNDNDDPLISLVVFEWADKDLIGHPLDGQDYGAVSTLVEGYICGPTDRVDAETIHLRPAK